MDGPTTINRTMSLPEWSMLIALSALWGGSFFFVSSAVRELPPLTLVLLRVGLAAVLLNAFLLLTRSRLPRRAEAWTAFAGMAVLNNLVPFCLFVWAQTRLPSGVAAILNATTPLFGVLVAHALVPDEQLTPRRFAGICLGFLGVVVMVGPGLLSGFADELLAELACRAAALSYAFSGVFGRRFARLDVTPAQTATGQVTASTVMLLPIVILADQPWTLPAPSAETWAAVFGLASLSTALGYILFFRILSTAGATNLLLVTFLIPISAILLGTALLGEAVTPLQLAGMALIGLGLAAIDGRLLRPSHRPSGGAPNRRPGLER